MAKAVFNLDLGGGIIKHTHPEQTQNTSDISTISSDYVSLTQDQTIYANKTIVGNVFMEGLFTATSAVFFNIETIPLSGSTIVLNYNLSGAPFEDGTIIVNRGSEADAYLNFNEALNIWEAGLSGDLNPIALENTEVDFSQVNVGDSITALNATRPFNIADTNGVGRILSISLDPSLEFLHRDTADGADNAYWDVGADNNDYFYIRKRTGGPVLSALTIDDSLNIKTYGNIETNLSATYDIGSHEVPFNGVHASYIDFHTSVPPAYGEGIVFYDTTDNTLGLYPEVSGVTLQIGQEQWLRAVNRTGGTLTNGTVVYVNDSRGDLPTIAKADPRLQTAAKGTIGVVTHDIDNNQIGYVTTYGFVRGLDTSGIDEGASIYLSEVPGVFENNIFLDAPLHPVRVGFCIRSHANEGIILVKVNTGYDIWEIHDVLNSVSGAVNGDILSYNSSLSGWEQSNRLTTTETDIDYLSGQLDTTNINVTANDADIDYLSGQIDVNSEYISVNQASHNLSVSDAIYNNAGTWTKAQADDADTLGVGVVTSVEDTDNFTYVSVGKALLSAHGFTEGQYLFVSPSVSGELTESVPNGLTEYSNPLGYVLDSDNVLVFPWRPVQALTRSNDTRTNAVTELDYTVQDTDEFILGDATSGALSAWLPIPSTTYDGFTVELKKIDATANPVSFYCLSGNIDSDSALLGKHITTKNNTLTVTCDGTDYWVK